MKPDFAVIFDMDGVIVDNFEFHQQAWKLFLEKYEIEITGDFRSRVFGSTNEDHFKNFFGRKLTKSEIREFEETKEAIYRNIYESEIRPVDGLIRFLTELKQHKIPIALATSSPRVNVKFVLEKTGTNEFFPVILDSVSVSRGKPHPEIYLKAAEALNHRPAKCIVFEDAIVGILAAKNAGTKVIALTTTHNAGELPEVDLIINDFTGLDLSVLENLV
ncbi:MAG: HAD family phosphatase [Bacteroidetes bacterium]|nr:HAD family phosphatase [Bacteroidota bacterium]